MIDPSDYRSSSSLGQALLRAAETEAGITYLEATDPELDVRVSYSEVSDRARRILWELQQRGLGPGSEVVFQLDVNQSFVEAFWACQLGGMLPIPINAGTTDEHLLKLFNVLAQTRAPTLLTQGRIPERLWEYARRTGIYNQFTHIFKNAVDMGQFSADGGRGEIVERHPHDIASLQYSSGSTGTPKGVVLTHKNLLADIDAIIEHCEMTTADSYLSWVPLTHDLGMVMYHLLPIVLGVNQFLMPATRFARRPLAWLESTSRHQATVLCSPNFGYQHTLKAWSKRVDPDLDLSSVRIVVNGAEPISKSLCDEFLAAFAPSGLAATAMWPTWGLAESTAAMTMRSPQADVETMQIQRDALVIGAPVPYATEQAANRLEVVCVGVPVPGCTLSIRNDEGGELLPDHYGHVFLQGPMVSDGYYGQSLHSGPDHWLDTGDLGFCHAGGLYILGRAKDAIIVNGVNYHPNDLERACGTAAEIEPSKISVCSVYDPRKRREVVLVFVVHRKGSDEFQPLAQRVRRVLGQQVQIDIDQVLPVRSLPKTTSGKVQRYQLGERYLQGEFDAAVAELAQVAISGEALLPTTELEQTLLHIFNQIIPDVQIELGDNIVEAGVSSLSLAEIAEYLDGLYPDLLELSDFLEYPTIPELAAHIVTSTGPGQGSSD